MTWQREMPSQPGLYWARNSDGDETGPLQVCREPREGWLFCPRYPKTSDRGLFGGPMIAGTSFRGWWWSEPLPPCPDFEKPPKE